MEFSYDRWNQLEDIELILCNPNKQKIGVISAVERKVTLRLNDLAELTFDVPRYAANSRGEVLDSPYYDWVQTMRLIFADQIGWFVITKVEEKDEEDGSITKSVTCESHQTIFKNFGFVTEERVYKFYDPLQPYDSLYTGDVDNYYYYYDSTDIGAIPSVVGQLNYQLGVAIDLDNASPSTDTDNGGDYDTWTLTYVTPSLWYYDETQYETERYDKHGYWKPSKYEDWENICRTLSDNTTNGYDFMVNDIEDAFEVVFCFDYLHHTIKVKTVEELTKKTNIYLSKDNILTSLDVTEDASSVATVLSCEGDSLDITLVNPMGTNYIVNFDYYMQTATDKNGKKYYPWMSEKLQDALVDWGTVYGANKEPYQKLVLELKDLYEEQLYKEERLTYLKTKLSDIQAVLDQTNDPDNEVSPNNIFTAEEVTSCTHKQSGVYREEYSLYPKSIFYSQPFFSDIYEDIDEDDPDYSDDEDADNKRYVGTTKDISHIFYDCDVEVDFAEELEEDDKEEAEEEGVAEFVEDDEVINEDILPSGITYVYGDLAKEDFDLPAKYATGDKTTELGFAVRYKGEKELDHATVSVEINYLQILLGVYSVYKTKKMDVTFKWDDTDTGEKGTIEYDGDDLIVRASFTTAKKAKFRKYSKDHDDKGVSKGDLKSEITAVSGESRDVASYSLRLLADGEDSSMVGDVSDQKRYILSGNQKEMMFSETTKPSTGDIEYPYYIDCNEYTLIDEMEVDFDDTSTVLEPNTTDIKDAGYDVKIISLENKGIVVNDALISDTCQITVSREETKDTAAVVSIMYAYNGTDKQRRIKTTKAVIKPGEKEATIERAWNAFVKRDIDEGMDYTYQAAIYKVEEYQYSEVQYTDRGDTYCQLYSEVQSIDETIVDESDYDITYSFSPQFEVDDEGNETDVQATTEFPNGETGYLYKMIVNVYQRKKNSDGTAIEPPEIETDPDKFSIYDLLFVFRCAVNEYTYDAETGIKSYSRPYKEEVVMEAYDSTREGDDEYDYTPCAEITITGITEVEGVKPSIDTTIAGYEDGYAYLDTVTTVVYQLAGFTRYASYSDAFYWVGLYNAEINGVQSEYDDVNEVIDCINDELAAIADQTAILSYFNQNYSYLIPELKSYWIESTYTNDNLAVLDTTTMAEQIDLANQLMEAGEEELSLVAQPRFSFTAEGINFIFLPEFKPFAKEVEMGCVVTVEKEEGVFYYPALSEVQFSLDDFSSFSMTFTNRARLDDFGYTIADLISSSSSTSNTINNNWSNLMKYVNQEDEIKSIITNPLSETFALAKNNAANQEFCMTDTGFWGRKLKNKDIPGEYYDEQVRMTNNILMFTDDYWKSIKTALGKVSVDGQEYYGLIAEAVVGDLIFGQQLHIVNADKSISLDSNGLTIYNKEGEEALALDKDGNLVMKSSGITVDALYDENGNKVYDSGTFIGDLYGYDSYGNLVHVIENGETVGTFYDAKGNIIYDGSEFINVYDESGNPVEGAGITYEGKLFSADGETLFEDGKFYNIYDASGTPVYSGGAFIGDLYDANGDLLYSKGNFVGDIYTESGDKIYSDGDYYGDHYVSCIALDDHGLTILNSGGIRIYKEAGDDGASIQYDENGDVLVGKEKADPVFYADDKGNLVLKGIVYADGGEFNGTIYATGGEFEGKITSSEGKIGGFTITKNSLQNGKLTYDDNLSGVYVGTDGIGASSVDEVGEDRVSGSFYISSDGEVNGVGCSFVDASISGSGSFGGVAADSISADNADIKAVRATTVSASGAITASELNIGGTEITSPATAGGIVYARASSATEEGDTYAYLRVTVELILSTINGESPYTYAAGDDKMFTVNVSYTADGSKESATLTVTVEGGDYRGTSSRQKMCKKKKAYEVTGCSFPSIGKAEMLIDLVMAGNVVPDTFFNGNLMPKNIEDASQNIGSSTAPWTNIYSNTIYSDEGEVKKSDENFKNSIELLPDEYSLLFDKLRPVRYKMNFGTSNRYHTGFIAQQVFQAVADSGLTSSDFAGYVADSDSGFYGLRYDEFIALLVKEIQGLKERVKELEDKDKPS